MKIRPTAVPAPAKRRTAVDQEAARDRPTIWRRHRQWTRRRVGTGLSVEVTETGDDGEIR